jgi:hypothetical protein
MMAPRKDMMRIIRQDAGFSAKLGFGGPVAKLADAGDHQAPPVLAENATKVEPPAAVNTVGLVSVQTVEAGDSAASLPASQDRSREATGSSKAVGSETAPGKSAAPSGTSSTRGHVVYVAVSLTARQATLAERWATAAKCSVQFLIRRVAQGLREEVFDDWEVNGMPDVDEPRGARGRHPTSVTMTLRPQCAADLSARHDPLGIVGLARVMGPAFRARFETAFDAALAKAKLQSETMGDEE